MTSLPTEILEKILVQLSTRTLEICSNVCVRWNELANALLLKRAENIQAFIGYQTVQEVKAKSILSTDNDQGDCEKLAIIKTYGRTYLEPIFSIRKTRTTERMDNRNYGIREYWINTTSRVRKCGCDEPRPCLVLSLQNMPCHALVLVGMKGYIGFYHETDPIECDGRRKKKLTFPYKVEPAAFQTSPDAHLSYSIYQDHFVAQETTRYFAYCRIKTVDHEKRIVVIDRLKRVFTPFWSKNLLLFGSKVFIQYTTGCLGFWSDAQYDEEESFHTLHIPLGIGRLTPDSNDFLTRINNIVLTRFTKPATTEVRDTFDEEPQSGQPVWLLMDGSSDKSGLTMTMSEISLVDLINEVHFGEGICTKVFRIELWNKALLAHYEVVTEDPDKKIRKLICPFRIRRDPRKMDFINPASFRDLVIPVHPGQMDFSFQFEGILTRPFPIVQNPDWNVVNPPVANLFGIDSYSPNTRIYNVSLFSTLEVMINESNNAMASCNGS